MCALYICEFINFPNVSCPTVNHMILVYPYSFCNSFCCTTIRFSLYVWVCKCGRKFSMHAKSLIANKQWARMSVNKIIVAVLVQWMWTMSTDKCKHWNNFSFWFSSWRHFYFSFLCSSKSQKWNVSILIDLRQLDV